MIIAVDIGNTNTAFGVFRKNRLVNEHRVETALLRTHRRCNIELLRAANRFATEDIEGSVIVSVVPFITRNVAASLEKRFRKQPLTLSGTSDVGMTLRYHTPASLGADRICSAVAAYEKFGGPVIVVDFGTATTFEVVSRNGEFLGGVIAPGIGTMAVALHRRTAQLPEVSLTFPRRIIGKSTAENIRSGILFGALESVEGILRRIQRELGTKTTIVATGGFSSMIAKRTPMITKVEPTLVLDGARIIYERMCLQKNILSTNARR